MINDGSLSVWSNVLLVLPYLLPGGKLGPTTSAVSDSQVWSTRRSKSSDKSHRAGVELVIQSGLSFSHGVSVFKLGSKQPR